MPFCQSQEKNPVLVLPATATQSSSNQHCFLFLFAHDASCQLFIKLTELQGKNPGYFKSPNPTRRAARSVAIAFVTRGTMMLVVCAAIAAGKMVNNHVPIHVGDLDARQR